MSVTSKKPAVAVKNGVPLAQQLVDYVEAANPIGCRYCETKYRIFLDPNDHEPEAPPLPFTSAHADAVKYFKEEITREHDRNHPSPRFIMEGGSVVNRLSVVSDQDCILVQYEGNKDHRILDRFEAELLAERLIEFAKSKIGSTDIELSRLRHLTVQGSEAGVSLCFFSPNGGPRRDWVVLSHGDALAVAKQLKTLSSPDPAFGNIVERDK